MEIKENRVAVVTYTLRDLDGELIQEATPESPFAFIHGIGQVLPAFDTNLLGKKVGEGYEFKLDAAEAYGEYNDEMIENLDAKIFAEAPEEYMQVGSTLPMEANGRTVFGTIMSITDEVVQMDFNHPLAGKGLHFKGEILDVREATQEELDHGHVHGDGGVHH